MIKKYIKQRRELLDCPHLRKKARQRGCQIAGKGYLSVLMMPSGENRDLVSLIDRNDFQAWIENGRTLDLSLD